MDLNKDNLINKYLQIEMLTHRMESMANIGRHHVEVDRSGSATDPRPAFVSEKDIYEIGSISCGFYEGDRVKILRKASSNEGGWNNCWVDKMDLLVGTEGIVETLNHSTGVRLKGGTFCFPYFVLEKLTTFKPKRMLRCIERSVDLPSVRVPKTYSKEDEK